MDLPPQEIIISVDVPRTTVAAPAWSPPLTLEERLKSWFLPPGFYIDHLHRKELRRGEQEIGLVPFLASRHRLSLDVGANKGVYSYAMLDHSARVHAFEANPKMVDILRRWGRDRITLHAMAVGARSGSSSFYIPHSRRGHSNQRGTLVPRADESTTCIEVPGTRLDDLDLDNVGFIKVDVEGAELDVLAGASELIRRDRPNLLIETEEIHTGRPIEDALSEICAYGYDGFALVRGTLTPLGLVNMDCHHRNPASRADYLFNFVFLPRP